MILSIDSLTNNQIKFAEYFGIKLSKTGATVNFVKGDCLKVIISSDKVTVEYSQESEKYRGLALLKNLDSKDGIIEQKRRFDSLAAFYDCSRNAVLTVDAIKEFVLNIVALGFNQLYLYTEDTFEIPEYPYFGHYRGRYSADEIREVDAFAKEYGVELIPAVQTLAHLGTIFRWKCFSNIGQWGTLKCGVEETYEFLDKMFASIRRMYTTDKINIGMDEAHQLGADGMQKFLTHIGRVMKIAEKYGFKPIMWSDMFFKLAVGKLDFADIKAAEFDKSVLELIPDGMTLAYWCYSNKPQEYYNTMIESHLAMGKNMMFVGGFKKWAGFCPCTTFSVEASRTALTSCLKYGIKDVVITGWGDGGAEASLYTLLPGLVLYSEQCFCGDMNDETVNNKLKDLFDCELNDFCVIEMPNRLPDIELEEPNLTTNTNRTVLWNDPLMGPLDKHIMSGTDEFFSDLKNKLEVIIKNNGRFAYVFETIYCLCDFLSLKSEIGNKMRFAYKNGDRKTLETISNEIPTMVEKLDIFLSTFRKNWKKENKMPGFQVQDIRFGSLRARLIYTKETLDSYLSGDSEKIEELEEDSLYFDCRADDEIKSLHFTIPQWSSLSSTNPL